MQPSWESQPSHRGPLAHILHLEDSEPDRELVRRLLINALIDCEITAVATEVDFARRLNQESWDLILSDFTLPSFDGLRALAIAAKICPSTPFIFVTGTLGEDVAVESLKSGATDYVLKQRMSRLGGSVRRALNERAERLRREKAEADLLKSEEQLRFLAYHDSLTNLPNRALLQDRLILALSSAERRSEKVALLFVDLDQFKLVNDSLGRSAGDLILKQVAERLERCAGNGDTVARLEGDEFAVVICGVKDGTDAAFAANRIKQEMAAEFTIGGAHLSATCSIGVSVFPEDGRDCEALFKNADAALFNAKELGRNQWQFFTPEMNRGAMERLSIESSLRNALKKQQFFLEYQPQIELSTGKIIGAEALLRWRHSEEGLIPPDRFIPIAESNGEIIPIGAWVLKTACAQAKQWQAEGLPPLTMAVNISAVQVRQGSLPKTIKDILDETGLAPEYLELETTESLLLTRDESVTSQMLDLRNLGLRMAIDDFGTGYSSFSYVRRFRFDKLKIDGSFVRNLVTDPDDAEITSGIISFGTALKMEVIAECVETKEQSEILRSLGCDQIQGYYFSRPLGAPAFAELLRSQSASLPARPRMALNALQLSRKKLEMAMSLSEALMKNLPAAVCISDASGQVLRWNTNFLSYPFDEIQKTGLMSTVASESLDTVQKAMEDAFELGKSETEAWLIAKSGAKIPCYLTGVRITFEDQPCILGIAIEISKQKQAEEMLRNSENKYRALFEGAADAYLVSNDKGFLDCNEAALRMFGYSTKYEFIGMHAAELSPQTQPDGTDSRIGSEQKVSAAMCNGSVRFEWVHKRRNGELFPAEICISAIMLSSGPALLGTIRDLTGRMRAEEVSA